MQPVTSPEHADQASLVQAEIIETMDRLCREGMDWRVVLTGACTAVAVTVSANLGDQEVPRYFRRWGDMAEAIASDGA